MSTGTQTITDILAALRSCPAAEVEVAALILADCLEDTPGRSGAATWVRDVCEWSAGFRPPTFPRQIIFDALTVPCSRCRGTGNDHPVIEDGSRFGRRVTVDCHACAARGWLLRPGGHG